MKKFVRFLFVLSLLFLNGCKETRQELSEVLHEEAVISETVYTPSRHETGLGLTAIKMGSFGMDYSGDLGLRLGGGLQVSSTTVPEKFAVVFRCQHGKFIVTKKAVYDKLKDQDGKTVDVTYHEVYKTTYDTVDGEKKVTNRILADYQFVDATVGN